MGSTSKRNEEKLKKFLKKPVGRPRKHNEGSLRLPKDFKNYAFIANTKQVAAMKSIADADGRKIYQVYFEAIENYLLEWNENEKQKETNRYIATIQGE